MEWMISYMSKSSKDAEAIQCSTRDLSAKLTEIEPDLDYLVRIEPTGADEHKAFTEFRT